MPVLRNSVDCISRLKIEQAPGNTVRGGVRKKLRRGLLRFPGIAWIQRQVPIAAALFFLPGAHGHAMRFTGKTLGSVRAPGLLLFPPVRNFVRRLPLSGIRNIDHALGHTFIKLHRHPLGSSKQDAIPRLIFALEDQFLGICFRRGGLAFCSRNVSPASVLHFNVKSPFALCAPAQRFLTQSRRPARKYGAKREGQQAHPFGGPIKRISRFHESSPNQFPVPGWPTNPQSIASILSRILHHGATSRGILISRLYRSFFPPSLRPMTFITEAWPLFRPNCGPSAALENIGAVAKGVMNNAKSPRA